MLIVLGNCANQTVPAGPCLIDMRVCFNLPMRVILLVYTDRKLFALGAFEASQLQSKAWAYEKLSDTKQEYCCATNITNAYNMVYSEISQ